MTILGIILVSLTISAFTAANLERVSEEKTSFQAKWLLDFCFILIFFLGIYFIFHG